ncbi:MAG TPA: DUF4240 domain-containing protein [Planctomycetota bacterium]|nr:DUF4240 domain-containing protein [Planctomycetota bacterium]
MNKPKGPDADLWEIIARVEHASAGELNAACDAFRAELELHDDDALIAVVAQFDAAMLRAYDWDLWGAACVIHGGTSDDNFWDFRTGLIALGREIFERSLRDPDSLCEIEDVVNRTLYEGFQYAPDEVLKARGLDPYRVRSPGPRPKPSGTPWTEDELPRRYPRLHARFGGWSLGS